MFEAIKDGYRSSKNGAVMLALRARYWQEARLLNHARQINEKNYSPSDKPLISITIATYNRAEILVERTLPTVLNQTYDNFEVIIVGDHCTDNTAEYVSKLGDERIRFINLEKRGRYPEKRLHHWMVAGTVPINRALQESNGDWIAHLDDDDCYEPSHLEEMLNFAQTNQVEMAYSKMSKQMSTNEWAVLGENLPFARRHQPGTVPHSAAFFRSYLKLFQFDINSWRYDMAGDKQVWLRMEYAGVRAGFLDKVTVSSPLRPGITLAHEKAEDRA